MRHSPPRPSQRRFDAAPRPRVGQAAASMAASGDQVGAIALTVLFACGGTLGLFIGLWPPAGVEPTYSLLSGIATFVIAFAFWHQRRRISQTTLHVAATAGVTLVVYGTYTGAGTFTGVAAPYFFGWLALFAFAVFPVRPSAVYVATCSLGYAGVLVLQKVPEPAAHWVLTTGTMVASGVVVGVLRSKLHRLATRDPLTGLFNRQCLDAALDAVIADVRRHELPSVVGILDLNDFKAVNDEYGHQRGDAILIAVADELRRQLRLDDVVVRYGGDEFVVILPRTDMAGAATSMTRLTVPQRCSIGLTPVHATDTPETLLRRADAELYRAKPTSRGSQRLVSISAG